MSGSSEWGGMVGSQSSIRQDGEESAAGAFCRNMMNVIGCIDDGEGVMFNHRRQSQDAVLRQRVIELSADSRLLMSPYTARQFRRDMPENAVVSDAFLEEAEPGDYCFVEDIDPSPYSAEIEKLIIYRWNRDYPRDTLLPFDLTEWNLVSTTVFQGSSHETITEEVFER